MQHLFYKFSNVLEKVCFFGDPKQRKSWTSYPNPLSSSCLLVPPYGAEEAKLETIFDIKHLKRNAYFLNVQCDQSPLS